MVDVVDSGEDPVGVEVMPGEDSVGVLPSGVEGEDRGVVVVHREGADWVPVAQPKWSLSPIVTRASLWLAARRTSSSPVTSSPGRVSTGRSASRWTWGRDRRWSTGCGIRSGASWLPASLAVLTTFTLPRE